MEHLRRLTRELRVVRACRDDALADRRVLVMQRDEMRDRCQRLRQHVAKVRTFHGILISLPVLLAVYAIAMFFNQQPII
jgi:hypothetical protein